MIPVFLDSARKHKNLARTYKNWLPDVCITNSLLKLGYASITSQATIFLALLKALQWASVHFQGTFFEHSLDRGARTWEHLIHMLQ
jgi:hypothetical protein